jgi:hypothetical protein
MPYKIVPYKNGYRLCKLDGSKCFSDKPMSLKKVKKQLKAIGMSGGSEKLKMFELFKGTGSVGKVAKKMGFEVISLDFDPIYTPDIETDILKWDYKKWSKDNNFIPNYIWASPPCNTYSPLAYPLKERNTQTAKPISERAKVGTKILFKTLEIIEYFKKLNPKLLFTIENPRGMMRKHKEMQNLPNLETTLYCLYGDFKRKPTDFWSNYKMNLVTSEIKCKNKTIGVVDLKKIEDRYSIPAKLIKQILTVAKDKILNHNLEGGSSPTFDEYLKENYPDFYKMQNYGTRQTGKNSWETVVSSNDKIEFDKPKFDKLMSEALSEKEFNELKKENPRRTQTYEEYIKSFETIARARSTRNVSSENRMGIDKQNSDTKNKIYQQYLETYPDMQKVMCNVRGEDRVTPYETTQGQCKEEHKKYDRRGFFGKITGALTDVGDFVAENLLDKLPLAGQIAGEVYKNFAPPGSKFYSGSGIPKNKKLYDEIKKEIYEKQPKHSLYRSARIIKEYKKRNGQFKESKENPLNIPKWFKQDWLDVQSYLEGKEKRCGSVKNNKYPLCRPKKILEKLTDEQMKKMLDEKQKLKEKPLITEKLLKTDEFNIKPTLSGMGKKSFKSYIESQNIDTNKYLKLVKQNAKNNGYEPNKLKWAEDGKHKFTYENIPFGAMKYNDYLLYQLKEGSKVAEIKRRNYRKRAESTMKATNNKFSPASLSYYILW